MKRLYLFTARYPYEGTENFLEDEIIYLSKRFDQIIIVPYMATFAGIRDIPANCQITRPIINGKFDLLTKGLFHYGVAEDLLKEFFCKHVYASVKRLKVWLTGYGVSNSIANSPVIKEIGRKLEKNDVCYFYWGKWSNILAVLWNGKAQFVSRFHGQWDLWEDEYGNYAPLREKVAQSLNTAVFISEKGERYFHQIYSKCPTRVFRLGSKDIGIARRSADEWIRILSCSTVYPLKRVDLILKSVIELSKNRNVKWTHLGGGVDFYLLKTEANKAVSEHLQIDLLGQKTFTEVFDYYKTNPFDVFINLSTNEGVPVSIMEAASCDVPIVATNVGCTSEIVNSKTGELISADPSPEEVAKAIIKVLDNRDTYYPRQYWKRFYKAEKNYESFADFLVSLCLD